MRDLSEAELIEMESRVVRLIETVDVDIDGFEDFSRVQLQSTLGNFYEAFGQIGEDVFELVEHLRAVSIESQKMENAASRL